MTEAKSSDDDMVGCAADLPSRAPRQSVFLSATVEHFGGHKPTTHRVRDLSTGGLRIDHAAGLQPGATVLVSVGALDAVGATVVWASGDLAGLKFAEPIDPQAARAKAAVAPQLSREQPRVVKALTPTAGWAADLRSPYRR